MKFARYGYQERSSDGVPGAGRGGDAAVPGSRRLSALTSARGDRLPGTDITGPGLPACNDTWRAGQMSVLDRASPVSRAVRRSVSAGARATVGAQAATGSLAGPRPGSLAQCLPAHTDVRGPAESAGDPETGGHDRGDYRR